MDPEATIALIRDPDGAPDERVQALINLNDWIRQGGFMPPPHDESFVPTERVHQALDAIGYILDRF